MDLVLDYEEGMLEEETSSFSDQLEQVLSDLAVDTRQDRHEATFFW